MWVKNGPCWVKNGPCCQLVDEKIWRAKKKNTRNQAMMLSGEATCRSDRGGGSMARQTF